MKKILISFLIICLSLTGCGKGEKIEKDNEVLVAEDKLEEKVEIIKEEIVLKSIEEYKEMIDPNIGVDDILESVKLDNNDIEIIITLSEPTNNFSYRDIAVNRVASITDELLELGGELEEIHIIFTNLGSIILNTNEKTTSDFGDYFDGMLVEEKFED